MDSDVVEGSKKAKADTEQESSTKRAGEELEQEKAKKQSIDEHVEEEKESEGLNQCFEIVPEDGDDVTIDATPLSTRSPNIVDYKIYKEGKKSFFQIIRADGNSQMYLTFVKMLKNFNREDLEVLWNIVKDRFKKTEPENYMDNYLLLTLKTMFEHHFEDSIWKKQQGLTKMFNVVKLQVDYECEMAYELLRLVKRQLKEGYKINIKFKRGLLGLKDFKMILRVTTAQVKVAGSLVILVYEEIKCGVLLPKNISQKNFVRYVRKKFNVEDNKELLLSYNIGSNSFNIIDEDDVDFFLKAVLESVTHEWMKNSLNYLPPTPHAPILDLKSITTSHHGVKFSAKTKFADKEACMYEIGVKCITEGYEYKVVRSCPQRYAVECVHLDCYWYIFTRRIKKENGFRVTYINDNHTCPKTQFYPNHRNATAKMLCQLIILKFSNVTRVYRPKDIINDLNIEFNIDVSYKRAWKGKQLALKSNQGDPISSFAQLPYYCYNLKLANENTITHIDTDHKGRFKMLFIEFGAAVRI
ncbi:hypothetical protein Tco_0517535 [Tanacetum coccineum]